MRKAYLEGRRNRKARVLAHNNNGQRVYMEKSIITLGINAPDTTSQTYWLLFDKKGSATFLFLLHKPTVN